MTGIHYPINTWVATTVHHSPFVPLKDVCPQPSGSSRPSLPFPKANSFAASAMPACQFQSCGQQDSSSIPKHMAPVAPKPPAGARQQMTSHTFEWPVNGAEEWKRFLAIPPEEQEYFLRPSLQILNGALDGRQVDVPLPNLSTCIVCRVCKGMLMCKCRTPSEERRLLEEEAAPPDIDHTIRADIQEIRLSLCKRPAPEGQAPQPSSSTADTQDSQTHRQKFPRTSRHTAAKLPVTSGSNGNPKGTRDIIFRPTRSPWSPAKSSQIRSDPAGMRTNLVGIRPDPFKLQPIRLG
jgi:hypothetical protein